MNRRLAVWIIVGAILLIPAGLALMIWANAEAAWAAMNERTKVMIDEARSRPSPRAVLRGVAVPGNAWTDYEAALAEFPKSQDEFQLIRQFAQGNTQLSKSWFEDLPVKYARAVDLMRQGTQRAEAIDPKRWTSDVEIMARPSRQCSTVAAIAVFQAKEWFEAGRHREAVELMLDVLQFASDIRRQSTMHFHGTGQAVAAYPLFHLGEIISKGKFTPEELKEIDRQLELLDRDWPDASVNLRNHAIYWRAALMNGGPEAWPIKGVTTWGAWRYGLSKRLAAVDAVGWTDRFVERAAAIDSMPWKEYMAGRDAIAREIDLCPNPLVKPLDPLPKHELSTGRHLVVQLRLLRVAVRYRLTGKVAAMADPFGTQILHAEDADKLTIWSVGMDCADNGGKGYWYPHPDGSDVRLEIPK